MIRSSSRTAAGPPFFAPLAEDRVRYIGDKSLFAQASRGSLCHLRLTPRPRVRRRGLRHSHRPALLHQLGLAFPRNPPATDERAAHQRARMSLSSCRRPVRRHLLAGVTAPPATRRAASGRRCDAVRRPRTPGSTRNHPAQGGDSVGADVGVARASMPCSMSIAVAPLRATGTTRRNARRDTRRGRPSAPRPHERRNVTLVELAGRCSASCDQTGSRWPPSVGAAQRVVRVLQRISRRRVPPNHQVGVGT